jgi:hypothetical protein
MQNPIIKKTFKIVKLLKCLERCWILKSFHDKSFWAFRRRVYFYATLGYLGVLHRRRLCTDHAGGPECCMLPVFTSSVPCYGCKNSFWLWCYRRVFRCLFCALPAVDDDLSCVVTVWRSTVNTGQCKGWALQPTVNMQIGCQPKGRKKQWTLPYILIIRKLFLRI